MTPSSMPDPSRRRLLGLLAGSAFLASGCSVSGTSPGGPRRKAFLHEQFIKTDLDHFAEVSQRRLFLSMRQLAEKLYRRNPREWRKSGAATLEDALVRIFDTNHGWDLAALGGLRDIEALTLAFEPEFAGDRVMAFSVGLASMVQTAYGNRVGFYIVNDLSAQAFYNAARNVEIAAWKLATNRDERGELLLLSNEMGEVQNLSFEREMGRIIGILETMTDIVEIKTERLVVRIVQGMATAVFLPVP